MIRRGEIWWADLPAPQASAPQAPTPRAPTSGAPTPQTSTPAAAAAPHATGPHTAAPDAVVRRPVLVVQSDAFNRSRVPTALVVAVSANILLADAPGNVPLPGELSGLYRDAVIDVTRVTALDRRALVERVGRLPDGVLEAVGDGLALVMGAGVVPARGG